jgi:GNAT superfamily N-acetyltransferase
MELNPIGTWLGLLDSNPSGFSNGFPIGDRNTQDELDPDDSVLFDPQGSVWLLRNVAIHKKHQRHGLGKLLIQRQIQLAREYGARQFRFTATEDLSDYYASQCFIMIRKPESFHGLPQGVWNLVL